MVPGAETSLWSATKYSMGKAVFLGSLSWIGGRTLSINTWFPGRTKQLSASDDGFRSGAAGAGTTGESGKSNPVTGSGRRSCSAVGLDNITE